MQNYGLILIYTGLSWSSYAACMNHFQMSWFHYSLGASVALIGVYLIHNSKKYLETSDKPSEQNQMRAFATNLELVCSELRICEKKYRLHQFSRVEVAKTASDIVDHRLSKLRKFQYAILHLFGINSYSEVASMCATGERFLRRSISAALDDYPQESYDYLVQALKLFERISDYLNLIRTHKSTYLNNSFADMRKIQPEIGLSLNKTALHPRHYQQ